MNFPLLSSRTQLITQNSRLQALSSKESAKNQCVINSVQLLIKQNRSTKREVVGKKTEYETRTKTEYQDYKNLIKMVLVSLAQKREQKHDL